MKGKHSKINCKLFPKIYKNIGIVALIAFAIYILIKTVQTQKMKKMEGFKEGRRNIKPREDNTEDNEEDNQEDNEEDNEEDNKEDNKEVKKESFNVPRKGNTIIIHT